jgi:hypothetical protein
VVKPGGRRKRPYNSINLRNCPSNAVWAIASGTLSDGDGAAGGQHYHAERSEASPRPARQTFRFAQGDKNATVRVHAAIRLSRETLRCAQGDKKGPAALALRTWTCVLG